MTQKIKTRMPNPILIDCCGYPYVDKIDPKNYNLKEAKKLQNWVNRLVANLEEKEQNK